MCGGVNGRSSGGATAMKLWHCGLALACLVVLGCAESAYERSTTEAAAPAPKAYGLANFQRGAAAPAPAGAAAPADKAGGSASPAPTALPRKIIYNAEVALTTGDFPKFEDAVARLVKEAGGYLAESNVYGTPGANRTGRWKARIPVERFDSFVDAVVGLGELQSRQTNSQDVTEEFYDLEVRIKNKKVEEARLLKHLEESTGKLKEILDVEKEISRVREEVERLQGRLQLLANLTSLTTVTITVTERTGYVPAEAPTFLTRIGRTFRASIDGLVQFLESVVLAIVALAPWVVVLALLLGLLGWLALRARARRRAAVADAQP
jgi:hypothetical protein